MTVFCDQPRPFAVGQRVARVDRESDCDDDGRRKEETGRAPRQGPKKRRVCDVRSPRDGVSRPKQCEIPAFVQMLVDAGAPSPSGVTGRV
jgi:hypothetical protein